MPLSESGTWSRPHVLCRAERIRTSGLLIPSLDAMEPFDEVHRRSPHVLRDGAASLLIAQACRSRRSLGHSSIRITADVHGHLLDEAGDSRRRHYDDGALGVVAALAAPFYVNIC